MNFTAKSDRVVPYRINRIEDAFIIENLVTGDVHELNETAFSVLEFCKEKLSHNQIVNYDEILSCIMVQYNVSIDNRELVKADIERTLCQLKECGLIVNSGKEI